MIRVLIADDSAFMRKVLSDLFASRPDFEVAGTAINGVDAVAKVKQLKPDVLTLDVNMPVMNGLEALKIIMRESPLPVVMLSSMTDAGSEETIKALELGAVEFVSKPGGSICTIDSISDEIINKCYMAVKANIKSQFTSLPKMEPPKAAASQPAWRQEVFSPSGGFGLAASHKLIAIGTSTGGPKALQHIIPRLPANLPCGVVVVQHMPAGFTQSLARRLNELSKVTVKEAENGEPVKPGHVYIAPGNYHMRVRKSLSETLITLDQSPPIGNHRPSVNPLFESASVFGRNLVAVILTGMGSDGTEGMKKVKAAGGYSIAENKESCVVYGMPRSVVELGLADEVLPLDQIAGAMVCAVKRN